MQKIKKGDNVIVISGKNKGQSGVVMQVHLKDSSVLVNGVNIVKRHQKQDQKHEGGIVRKEAAVHVSNVALIDTKTGKATRVGFVVENGKKIRVSKRSGEKIDV